MSRKPAKRNSIFQKLKELSEFLDWISPLTSNMYIRLIPIDHRRQSIRSGNDLFPRPFIRSPLWLPVSCILGIGMVFTRDLFEAVLSGSGTISLTDEFILTKGVLAGIGVGIYLLWFLFIEETLCVREATIQEEKIKRLSVERGILNSRLRFLKAQIKPHFLFNTLTSIMSLEDTAPEKARAMQVNFMQYLNEAFTQFRTGQTTVGEEMALIRSYLELFKIRMGKRLEYDIRAAEVAMKVAFPSMVIQPLVENAIKHGLEPKVSGGHIGISADIQGEKLVWRIADTGIGIAENHGLGIGLGNVIDRLDSLFGPDAELRLEDNEPSGTTVTIEVPCA